MGKFHFEVLVVGIDVINNSFVFHGMLVGNNALSVKFLMFTE